MPWNQVPTASRTGTGDRTPRPERESDPRRYSKRSRSEEQGRTRHHRPRNYHIMSFEEVPPPPLREDLKEHIGGFHPFTSEVMKARLPSKWQWPHMDTYDGTSHPDVHVLYDPGESVFCRRPRPLSIVPHNTQRPNTGLVLLSAR